MKTILGISAFYHDSAAAIIRDGEIIAAVQEEKFTRIKHDSKFPEHSVRYVLDELKITLKEVDKVVFYEKPFLKFERLLETYVANAPRGFKSFRKAMPIWLREKLFQKSLIIKELKKFYKEFKSENLYFTEHHESHAASAFYPSPFENAVILTIDGVGEWATTTVSIGEKNNIKIVKEIMFPHSIGLLYSAFTYYLGFKVNSGEYKVMGLAPYGEPKYKNLIINNILSLKEDGSFFLDQSYFNYTTGLTMTNKKFSKLFGAPVRKPEVDKLKQFHMDMASSIQAVIEEIIIRIVKNISKQYSFQNLCIAGGVGLNCVSNSKILKSGYFKNLWIQPASGDAGGALGAALLVWYRELKNERIVNKFDNMKGAFLGPQFTNNSVKNELDSCGAIYKFLEDGELIYSTASSLANGKTIGWFQNRQEFGPRALGNRSIIADPRSENMQKILNLKIKYRESFRPFAPSILREDLNKWFEIDEDSPYMLLVANVKKEHQYELTDLQKSLFGIDKLNIKRSNVPAITHIDYSARVQTVHKRTNPKYYSLISKFKELTGCPIIINTSFNVRGEPIVCTPKDAFKCFMGTDLDILVVENYFLIKNDQDMRLKENYKLKYSLD